ncbi:MAG: flavodoxin domain-containing protein, partial [Lachnospiraceae bacterium]
VYQSETGFTAKYAEWIAKSLGCEAVELQKKTLSELAEYDMVIYGGWICAGNVSGYDKIKELGLKEVLVFGVGMTPAGEETAAKIAEQNGIEREKFFYYEGGYRPEKLGFMKRMMMNVLKKSLEKKEEKTEDDLYMLKTFEGADHMNREAIEGLVAYCLKNES